MNRFFRNIFGVVSVLFVVVSCSDEGRQFSISSSLQGMLYSGDSVVFDVVSKRNKTPDSVVVEVDGRKNVYEHSNRLVLSTEGLMMGDKTVTFTIYYKGKKEKNFRSLRILSDLVPAQLQYNVVASYPHDTKAYTQGLQYENGKFYESTGLYGESTLRYVDVKTGKTERKSDVEERYFAEGLTLVGDTLYQLTWREQVVFLYDKKTFQRLGVMPIATEGWGMCFDGTYIIVSDGTEYLYFYEPQTFTLHHKVAVFDNLGAISRLNELEFVQGFVYANIYTTDKIVKINPNNGKVAAEIDFSNLLPDQYRSENIDVLNGIAWNPVSGHYYVTGKLWPRMFEVVLFFFKGKYDEDEEE